MFISESTINEIKNRLTISDVVSLYLPLVKKGRDNWVVCPFHSDKNPSMKLDDEKGFYYCFGCKASGNIFTFVMKMDNLDFVEAVKKLASIAHVEIEEERATNPKQKSDKEMLYRLYETLNNEFCSALWMQKTTGAKKALDYIYSRGYTDETIKSFSLGYAPEDYDFVKRIAASLGIEYSLLKNSGLLSKNENSYFVDRITFPIVNRSLKVVAFSARTMRTDDTVAKYINSSESPIFSKKLEFFGFNNAVESLKKGDIPVLCEGNFDVMALHQAGIKSALATCGTALSKEQCSVLRRYNDKTKTFFDSDDAGQKATMKALVALKSQGISPSVVVMRRDSAKDASEFLQKNGKDALVNLVNSSINGFQYAIKSLSRQTDITTIKGKKEVLSGLLPLINAVDSVVERENLFKKACSILAIDEKSAVEDYNRETRIEVKKAELKEQRQAFIKEGEEIDNSSIWQLYNDTPLYETTLMKELAYSRDLFGKIPILNQIDYRSFENPKAAALYALLREKADLDKIPDDDAFLESIDDEEMRSYLENARSYGMEFNTWSPEEKEDQIQNLIMRIIRKEKQKEQSFAKSAIKIGADTTFSSGAKFINHMQQNRKELDEIDDILKKRGDNEK